MPVTVTDSVRLYRSYGFLIQSSWPLPLLVESGDFLPRLELLEVSQSFFENITCELKLQLDESKWFQCFHLASGARYMRWTGLFEFLVSADGRRIWGHSLPAGTLERLQTYLMGQVISMALVIQGIEPLHATVVVVDGEAVAFLGDSGFGKSTLGAAFLKAGCSILTDDLLVIEKNGPDFIAQPGPARVKLFPAPAELLLSGQFEGVTMNPATPKLVLPLNDGQAWPTAAPISNLFILSAPHTDAPADEVEISRLSRRQACIKLIENTFNTVIQGPVRQVQQFTMATELAAGLQIKSLAYVRDLSKISRVVDAVLADVRQIDLAGVIE